MSAKMLATFIHFLRGTPYIYQGEEIGMTNAHFKSVEQYRDVESLNMYELLPDSVDKLMILGERSRDNSRTPMQWDSCLHKFWIDMNENCEAINVESQLNDCDSILNYYKKLIQLRKKYQIIADGSVEFLDTDDERLFAYKRVFKGEELYCYFNFSSKKIKFSTDYNYFFGNYKSFSSKYLRPYECAIFCNVS